MWAWNFALAIVCGDAVVWKSVAQTPLTALAPRVAARFGRCLLELGGNNAMILYVLGYRELHAAIALHNDAAQGLSWQSYMRRATNT